MTEKCEYMKGKTCTGDYYNKDCTKCMIPLFYKLDEMNRNLSMIAQRL